MDAASVPRLKVNELREALAMRDLSTKGLKSELVARLIEALMEEQGSAQVGELKSLQREEAVTESVEEEEEELLQLPPKKAGGTPSRSPKKDAARRALQQQFGEPHPVQVQQESSSDPIIHSASPMPPMKKIREESSKVEFNLDSSKEERRDRDQRSWSPRARDDYQSERREERERDRQDSDRKHESQPEPSTTAPTATASGVAPLHLRVRQITFWDIPPSGYEGMSPDQVKATGLFPKPGSGVRVIVHTGSAAGLGMMGGVAGISDAMARQGRRVYVGGLPPSSNEEALANFFNQMITSSPQFDKTLPGRPIVNVSIFHDKNFAFIEFRTMLEAEIALHHDGSLFQTVPLRIRRPKDYVPVTDGGPSIQGQISDSPDKLFIGHLPPHFGEKEVMEILQPFGEIKGFFLAKDASGQSKCYAFCEYKDSSVADEVCRTLNDLIVADKRLVVQRAGSDVLSKGSALGGVLGGGYDPTRILEMGQQSLRPLLPQLLPDSVLQPTKETEPLTRVLLMLNMVTADEMRDDQQYRDIVQEIKDECQLHGKVEEIIIPRLGQGPGVGKVYVLFSEAMEAKRALHALAGRKFSDRTVITALYDETLFHNRDFW